MSAVANATTVLIDAVEDETRAILSGGFASTHAATKLALAGDLERAVAAGGGDGYDAALAERLRGAAARNRVVLEAERRATADLLADLQERLATIESDGTYRRSDLLAPETVEPAASLPAPSSDAAWARDAP